MTIRIHFKNDSILLVAAMLLAAFAVYMYFPLVLDKVNHNDFMYGSAPVIWAKGGQLYSDVPFVQAPLSILIPSAIRKILGTAELYFSARLLSAGLVFLGSLLLAVSVKNGRDLTSSMVFLLLALGNSYILSAANEIGSYALPFFLMSFSCFIATRRISIETKVLFISIAIGFAASAKLNQILLLPGLLLVAYGRERVAPPAFLYAAVGATVGAAPILYYFFSAPEGFLLQNLTFHMLTNDVRGLDVYGSLRDIVIDSKRFSVDLFIPLTLLCLALFFSNSHRQGKVAIMTSLALAYLMAIAPMILFSQYLAALAGLVLFFCLRLVADLEENQRRIALAILIVFGALQLNKMVPRSNFYQFDRYQVSQVLTIQEQSKQLVDNLDLRSRKVFTTQPLFYLDDEAEYYKAAAAGPFWLLVFDGLPPGHDKKKDIVAELNNFHPDIVVFGFYSGVAEYGRLDGLVKDYAVNQKFEFSKIGSLHGRDIILAHRRKPPEAS